MLRTSLGVQYAESTKRNVLVTAEAAFVKVKGALGWRARASIDVSRIKNMFSALSKKVRREPITTNDDDADDEADVEEGDITDEAMAKADAEVELGSEEEAGSDDDEKNSGDEENEE